MTEILLAAGWPSALLPQALAVSHCESSWSPGAHNAGGPMGLFQIQPFWADTYGLPVDSLYDPAVNAQVARWIFERSGWSPWECRSS